MATSSDGLWLDIRGGNELWAWHRLSLTFGDGSGPHARVRGMGEVTRVMHTAATSAAPWGMFNGQVRWRLD